MLQVYIIVIKERWHKHKYVGFKYLTDITLMFFRNITNQKYSTFLTVEALKATRN